MPASQPATGCTRHRTPETSHGKSNDAWQIYENVVPKTICPLHHSNYFSFSLPIPFAVSIGPALPVCACELLHMSIQSPSELQND